MGYEKYYQGGWKSGEAGGTPITPEALNHMEQGIADAFPYGGGILTGDLILTKGKRIVLSDNPDRAKAVIGVVDDTGDVYIGTVSGGWLRIKSDYTMAINGQKVYTALDKPTAADVGAVPTSRTVNSKALSGNITLSASDVEALPIVGGTLTGELKLGYNNKTARFGAGTSDVFLNNSKSGKHLQLKDDGTLSYSDKEIFHAGNKPFGSYTGNGSATERTFSIPATSNVMFIFSGNGCAFLSNSTGIIAHGEGISQLPWAQAHFRQKTLTIATTNAMLNANGVIYYYECL